MMTSQLKTPAILNDNISRKIPDGSRISYYREFLNARSEGFFLKKCPGNTVQHAYTIGAFHSTRTFETLETAANGTEISRKSSRNPGNGWISEMRTTQPKFLEIFTCKVARKKTSWKIFRKFEYTTRGCPLLWKFLKMLVYSQLEVPENSTTGMNRGFGGMKSAPYFLSKLVVFLSFEICQFHFNQTLENKYRKLSWGK